MRHPWWQPLVGVSGPVLDVGSGSGSHAAELTNAGISVIAVDREPELAAAAKGRGVPAVVADGEALPFRTGGAAGATCLEVLEHVDQPGRFLTELRRALPLGAPLIVAVPTSYTERFLWRVHPSYASNSTHVRIFTRRDLTDTLQASDWHVRDCETRNLAAAIAWVFHGLVRTPADHTGAVQRLGWVERVVAATLKVLARLPGGARGLTLVESRFGKSWYIHAQ